MGRNQSGEPMKYERKYLIRYCRFCMDNDAYIEEYDTFYPGFPIWWYIALMIVNTFLEKYQFSVYRYEGEGTQQRRVSIGMPGCRRGREADR